MLLFDIKTSRPTSNAIRYILLKSQFEDEDDDNDDDNVDDTGCGGIIIIIINEARQG
jgi:hypothetical protein